MHTLDTNSVFFFFSFFFSFLLPGLHPSMSCPLMRAPTSSPWSWSSCRSPCQLRSRAGPLPNDVVGVELFQRDNAKEHRTYKYDILDKSNPALVVRRGDPFYMAIQLRNQYDQDSDKIRLEFLFGKLLVVVVVVRHFHKCFLPIEIDMCFMFFIIYI